MDPYNDPRSWHKGRNSEDQLHRAERWHRRAKSGLDRALSGGLSREDWDDIYAFFMNAYHVGDWMIADGTITRKVWSDYVAEHFELSLCRDLCNGVKHRRLTGRPSVDPSPWTRREYVPAHNASASPGERWYVLAGETKEFRPLTEIIDLVVEQLWRLHHDARAVQALANRSANGTVQVGRDTDDNQDTTEPPEVP